MALLQLLAGYIDESASTQGYLRLRRRLAGETYGTSTISGRILPLRGLKGQIAGHPEITGRVIMAWALRGRMEAKAIPVALMRASKPLTGRIDCQATINALLRYLEETDPEAAGVFEAEILPDLLDLMVGGDRTLEVEAQETMFPLEIREIPEIRCEVEDVQNHLL